MVCLNKTIDIPKIITNYETIPFHCFHKHIPSETPSQELLFESKVDAFTIELYHLKSDVDNRLAYDFLLAAFDIYPNLNFCIILVPKTMKYFSLLKYFTVIFGEIIY